MNDLLPVLLRSDRAAADRVAEAVTTQIGGDAAMLVEPRGVGADFCAGDWRETRSRARDRVAV